MNTARVEYHRRGSGHLRPVVDSGAIANTMDGTRGATPRVSMKTMTGGLATCAVSIYGPSESGSQPSRSASRASAVRFGME